MSEDRCRESLAGASEGQIGLWAVLWYDGEVNNGGHWQFFDNSAGMIWKEVLFGFELIGDQERLDILRRACSLFPEGNPPCERHERSIALEIIECGKAKMNALDDEFYALSSDAFDGRMAGFIQAHPEQFFFPD